MIRHIVLARFRPDADEAARQAVRDAIAGLRHQIPGIVDMRWGDDIGRKAASADFAVVIDFVDRAAFAAYGTHPAHRAYAEGAGKAAIEGITVVQHEL